MLTSTSLPSAHRSMRWLRHIVRACSMAKTTAMARLRRSGACDFSAHGCFQCWGLILSAPPALPIASALSQSARPGPVDALESIPTVRRDCVLHSVVSDFAHDECCGPPAAHCDRCSTVYTWHAAHRVHHHMWRCVAVRSGPIGSS